MNAYEKGIASRFIHRKVPLPGSVGWYLENNSGLLPNRETQGIQDKYNILPERNSMNSTISIGRKGGDSAWRPMLHA